MLLMVGALTLSPLGGTMLALGALHLLESQRLRGHKRGKYEPILLTFAVERGLVVQGRPVVDSHVDRHGMASHGLYEKPRLLDSRGLTFAG